MPVRTCYLCNQDPITKRHYGNAGLAEGMVCPTCYQPTCRYHLTTVRWRWHSTNKTDDTLICKECKRTYTHRKWDAANREWIT